MRYLVVLDVNSPVGAFYAAAPDGFIKVNGTGYPALDCTTISVDVPGYLMVQRPVETLTPSTQTLYVPHQAVVLIARYNAIEAPPFGFVAC